MAGGARRPRMSAARRGFEMFLQAIADPAHEEHGHLLDWNDGPFDPEDIECDAITIQMSRLANMRRPKT